MQKMINEFKRSLDRREALALQSMAQMAISVATFSGTLSESDNAAINKVISRDTSTLLNIKIIRSLPISFN